MPRAISVKMKDVEIFWSYYEAADVVQLSNEAPGMRIDVAPTNGQRMGLHERIYPIPGNAYASQKRA